MPLAIALFVFSIFSFRALFFISEADLGQYGDTLYRIFTNEFPFLGAFLLIPLCIILGIVLLAYSGKKVNPLPIAIWGAAAALTAIPTAIVSLRAIISHRAEELMTHTITFIPADPSLPVMHGYVTPIWFYNNYFGLAAAAACVSFIAGIIACVLAFRLHRTNLD